MELPIMTKAASKSPKTHNKVYNLDPLDSEVIFLPKSMIKQDVREDEY